MTPSPLPAPTTYEAWSLAAQWVGSIAAVAAVAVAVVFGYLTLASNKRSKDAQQRATLVAALDDPGEDHPLGAVRPGGGIAVRHKAGETWLFVNQGSGAIRVSSIEGLTDLDKKRLTHVASDPEVLNPGDALEFVLVSRYTLSGPANIVVTFASEALGVEFRRILQVPAP